MYLDLAIVLVLVLFCVRSFRGGIQGELLGATGWLLAILIALSLCGFIGDVLASKVAQLATISTIVSFFILLVVLRLIIGWFVKIVPEQGKGLFYLLFKVLSVAAGFFKGAFFTSVLLLLISQSSLQPKLYEQINGSTLYQPIADFSKTVVRLTAENVPNVNSLLKGSSDKKSTSTSS